MSQTVEQVLAGFFWHTQTW